MQWIAKAIVQNAVAALPSALALPLYFAIQRSLGSFDAGRSTFRLLSQAAEVVEQVYSQGRRMQGATVLEVGTGRRANLPLGLWLLGADRIVTVDLNPYFSSELMRADLNEMLKRPQDVRNALGGSAVPDRVEWLLDTGVNLPIQDLFEHCGIEYLSPCDATRLPIKSASVDFHVSYQVLEHIPPDTLVAIMTEAGRVLRRGGLAVHKVDFSDHFSHSDSSITPLHFLRFSERAFRLLAHNRFMYMNRLQVDDYVPLLEAAKHSVLSAQVSPDESLLRRICANEIPMQQRFSRKDPRVLATLSSWLVSECREAERAA
jgi:SAM-dependent methyltransferase